MIRLRLLCYGRVRSAPSFGFSHQSYRVFLFSREHCATLRQPATLAFRAPEKLPEAKFRKKVVKI